MQSDSKIKYDKKTLRNLRKAIIILAIIGILNTIVYGTSLRYIYRSMPSFVLDLVVDLEGLLIMMLIILGIMYISCKEYLSILKKRGYEVPEDKTKYNSKLSNLPKQSYVTEDYGTRSKGHIVLACITLGMAFAYVARAVDCVLKWSGVLNDIEVIVVGVLIVAFFWAFGAYRIFKESDNRKYFDPIAFDDKSDNKKKRTSVSSRFAQVLLVGIGCAIVIFIFSEFMVYIERSRIAADLERVSRIASAMETIVQNKDNYPEDEYNEFYNRLEEGFDICEVNWADNSISKELVDKVVQSGESIDSMNDIEKIFITKAKSAYIKLNDEEQCETTYSYLWEYKQIETSEVRRNYIAR